ncbi:unnamed protein product [Pylaiella littoralis]
MDIAAGGGLDVSGGRGSGGGGDGSSGSSSIGADERRRVLVASMSPEDILLCIDVGVEMNSEWAGAGPGGTTSSRMQVVKAALRGFVRRKASFNPKHRFALLALGDGVTVVRPLTSDIRSVFDSIDRLQPLQPPDVRSPLESEEMGGDTPFDFSELLRIISERFPPPEESSTLELNGASSRAGGASPGETGARATAQIRPGVRAVVLFGRSYTRPLVPHGAADKPDLLSHRRFSLDLLYLHHNPADERVVCQDIFNSIVGLETSGAASGSFFLECGHSMKRFHPYMAVLLAHPAQRDCQSSFFDKMFFPGGALSGGGAAMRVDSNASSSGGLGSGGSSVHGAA